MNDYKAELQAQLFVPDTDMQIFFKHASIKTEYRPNLYDHFPNKFFFNFFEQNIRKNHGVNKKGLSNSSIRIILYIMFLFLKI